MLTLLGRSSPYPKSLRYAELTVLSKRDCANKLPGLQIPDENLCVSFVNGKCPYFGDSGGPLVLKTLDPKNTIQIGVLMGGVIMEPGKPIIYTRVSAFIPWIEKTAGFTLNKKI